MDRRFVKARELLREFKGENYVFGLDCFSALGGLVAPISKRVSIVAGGTRSEWGASVRARALDVLASAGVQTAGDIIPGAAPNAPHEDVRRIAEEIAAQQPEAVVAVGAGSVIDATKAACVLVALGDRHPDIEEFFGVGRVSALLGAEKKALKPLVAVQLAASSASHLTKYSNVTDIRAGQKKLIVDEAIVPSRALFDYTTSVTMSPEFTADGGLDGIAHCWEVFLGAKGAALEKVQPVAVQGIELIVSYLKRACENGHDLAAREAVGLGTDLGGYAIMIGGTSGAHLTSFSLVDILPHGRACALMNPYYTVFFAPAVEPQLREIADVFRRAGYLTADTTRLRGRDLGVAVAEAMIALSRAVGLPTRLADVPGFSPEHVRRALTAAKNPQLESKLKNMPVPLTAAMVDDYMGPVLEAATTGDFSVIRTLE